MSNDNRLKLFENGINALAFVKFAEKLKSELESSDAIPGMTPRMTVRILNEQLLQMLSPDTYSYIETPGAKPLTHRAPAGIGGNGGNGGNGGTSAQSLLDSWANSASSARAMRDDPQGKDAADYQSVHLTYTDPSNASNYAYDKFMANVERFNDPTKEYLPFGVSTAASDARLMARRTERRPGNGIWNRNAAMHRRNFESDIGESMAGVERETRVYGYNMQPLYARVDKKNARTMRDCKTMP